MWNYLINLAIGLQSTFPPWRKASCGRVLVCILETSLMRSSQQVLSKHLLDEWTTEAEGVSWWRHKKTTGHRGEGLSPKPSSAPTSCVTLGSSFPICTMKSLGRGAPSPFGF